MNNNTQLMPKIQLEVLITTIFSRRESTKFLPSEEKAFESPFCNRPRPREHVLAGARSRKPSSSTRKYTCVVIKSRQIVTIQR